MLTQAEQLANVQAAIEAWGNVARETVDLSDWSHPCGTLHCFGGWLPFMKHFVALGVDYMTDGTPVLFTGGKTLIGAEVSDHLFGANLFNVRYQHEGAGSDWDIVMHRLQNRQAILLTKEQA